MNALCLKDKVLLLQSLFFISTWPLCLSLYVLKNVKAFMCFDETTKAFMFLKFVLFSHSVNWADTRTDILDRHIGSNRSSEICRWQHGESLHSTSL